MTVSTLLVCDDSSKTGNLETLINSRSELKLTSSTPAATAAERIMQEHPSLVWIELSPEPAKGLSVLAELREKFPSTQFLVSYDTLKADLIKSAMQLGAVEYIDPDSADRLLPDAIERIIVKLNEAVMGKPVARKVLAAPAVSSDLPPVVPDESYVPGATGQNRAVGGVRGKASQLEGSPGSLPVWLLPTIMLVMIVVAIIVALTRGH